MAMSKIAKDEVGVSFGHKWQKSRYEIGYIGQDKDKDKDKVEPPNKYKDLPYPPTAMAKTIGSLNQRHHIG